MVLPTGNLHVIHTYVQRTLWWITFQLWLFSNMSHSNLSCYFDSIQFNATVGSIHSTCQCTMYIYDTSLKKKREIKLIACIWCLRWNYTLTSFECHMSNIQTHTNLSLVIDIFAHSSPLIHFIIKIDRHACTKLCWQTFKFHRNRIIQNAYTPLGNSMIIINFQPPRFRVLVHHHLMPKFLRIERKK